jgi:hypothetical protein
METHQGILEKDPIYVMEKWNAINSVAIERLPSLLDTKNKQKYEEWLKRWLKR